jgi:hypothetical protein
VRIVRKFWIILLIILAGCGLRATRDILPVPNPDVIVLPRVKGIAATKESISIAVVPLPDVKELDAFGVIIANESPNMLTFSKEDCMLIQSGQVRYPLTDNQVYKRLGSSYQPSMPSGLNMDIYAWRQSVNLRSSRGLEGMIKEEKRLSIMGNAKEKIFLFFKTQDDMTPLQFRIQNIQNETTGQRTWFSFKFNIEKS